MRWEYSFRPHNAPVFVNYASIDAVLGAIRLWLLSVEHGEIPAVTAYLLPTIIYQGDEEYPGGQPAPATDTASSEGGQP